MYKRCLAERSEISLIKENDLLTNSSRSKINKPSPGVKYNLQISLHCVTYFCNNCTIQSLIITLGEQFICANVRATHKQQLSFTFAGGGGGGGGKGGLRSVKGMKRNEAAVGCVRFRSPYSSFS